MTSVKKKLHEKRIKAEQCGELKEKTVTINRVAKVVKGGRRFSFSALVVTGDGRGHIGFGLGKAGEVPDAIKKAIDHARKALITVPMKGTTIPHDIVGKYGPCTVILRAAPPGTGVIAGSVVRAVVESSGIKDINTKCIGSSNSHNVLHAIFNALMSLRDPEAIARARGMSVEDLGYTAL